MLGEADDFAAALIAAGWQADHIKVIKGKEATIRNVLEGYRWLDAQEDSEDLSVVFMSTHGSPLLGGNDSGIDIPPRDEADGADEILVSHWGFAFPMAFWWDDQINVLLNRLESKGVCLVVDSCYAGGFNDPSNWTATASTSKAAGEWVQGFGQDVRGQNRIVLMASREDELSYSGGFAPWLIDALHGYGDSNADGIVSAEEAFFYAQPRAYTQHPTIFDDYDGEFPLAILPQQGSTHRTVVVPQQGPRRAVGASATVQGYITEITTGVPLPNATVTISGRTSDWEPYANTTTTQADGWYELTIPPGRYRATATATGYCSRQSGTFTMNEGQMRWLNFSLAVRPVETAVLCGYITDESTGMAIEGANISLRWLNAGQFYDNQTLSEASGFYRINAAAGQLDLEFEALDYFGEHLDNVPIANNQTLWVNRTLRPHPMETAVICGFVTDKESGAPLSDVTLYYQWVDFATGDAYEKETATNTTGYYTITVAEGELYREVWKEGYDYYDPYRHDGVANVTSWQNVTIAPGAVEVDFEQPLCALYLNNKLIIPTKQPLIIGPINVTAYVGDPWYGGSTAEVVEFYLDGVLQATATQQPFQWSWTAASVGRHTIKLIAYDDEGRSGSIELEVRKFL
jgi:hypothetical protein